MKNQNRNSFVPYRGPVIGDPNAGLLPDPWGKPFDVPKAAPITWFKAVVILAVGTAVVVWALRSF